MESVDFLLDTILSNTYEADVLRHRLALWRSLLKENLFFETPSNDAQASLAAYLARAAREKVELPEHVEAVEQWMQAVRSLTRENINDAIDDLMQKVKNLPVLILSLAVDLPRNERERLGQWARQEVYPQVLLDLRRDPLLIGGVVIIWKNIETDRSVRLQLREHRDALREAFSSIVQSS